MFWRSAGRALRALALLQLQPPARTAPLPPRGPAACYGTSVTSAKIQVNGVYLHYQQTGEGSHAVLLLPGSGQTDFGPQLKSMNKQLFTIVAWDPRGYGKSIPPSRDFPPDFFERDAKDAVDLMQALKFEKFSLLGWSWWNYSTHCCCKVPKSNPQVGCLGSKCQRYSRGCENLQWHPRCFQME
uniref:Biphenyl hydrolase like n=1 Tax=Taeniopygia guttata TaxID=59729 RepID=H0YVC9_TAEGU